MQSVGADLGEARAEEAAEEVLRAGEVRLEYGEREGGGLVLGVVGVGVRCGEGGVGG